MIRFRPQRQSLSSSVKDEILFDSLDDLLRHIFDHWSRVVAFMGGRPFQFEEISIGSGRYNPMTGYNDEHPIFVQRMVNEPYPVPMCIGYCDMEVYL